MRNCELTDEACRSDAKAYLDERRALLDSVRPEGKDDRHDHCENVYRNGQKLGIGGCVAQLLNDRWNSCRESRKCTISFHSCNGVGVGLPIDSYHVTCLPRASPRSPKFCTP